MTSSLDELLGLDVADPETVAALSDANAYADLIKTLVSMREGQRLSQRVVAARMGTTQSAVSDVERIGGDPRMSTVQRYARAVSAHINFVVECTDWQWKTVREAMPIPRPPRDDEQADRHAQRPVRIAFKQVS